MSSAHETLRYDTPFHAQAGAGELAHAETLLPVFASSHLEVFPYQVAAARFVLGAGYLKGAVLCDEGSLGTTYEALLVIAQLYYEKRDRILIVVPLPLLRQWREVMEERFAVEYRSLDELDRMDDLDGGRLVTYEWAAAHAAELAAVPWDMVVLEEAHRLRKASKESAALQSGDADRRIQPGLGDSAGTRRSAKALLRAGNQRHDRPLRPAYRRTIENPLRSAPLRSRGRRITPSRPLLARVQKAALNISPLDFCKICLTVLYSVP